MRVSRATTERIGQRLDKTPYITHLLGYVDRAALRPLKIVADPGNGAAGPVMRLLADRMAPLEFVLINEQPDGHFPNGVPNPLLPERRAATAAAVREHGADFGIAWDGDFDRCFLFDAGGRFIEGYYLVGLLAEVMLAKHPGARILHDPRLTWNTIEQVRRRGRAGAVQDRPRVHEGAVAARRRRLRRRDERAPLLPRLRLLRQRHDPLASGGRTDQPHRTHARGTGRRAHGGLPCSGEINYRVPAVAPVIERVAYYEAASGSRTDGISRAVAVQSPWVEHRSTASGWEAVSLAEIAALSTWRLEPARIEHRAAAAPERGNARGSMRGRVAPLSLRKRRGV
jgi:phosphomannomutase / phosphoglucomutase